MYLHVSEPWFNLRWPTHGCVTISAHDRQLAFCFRQCRFQSVLLQNTLLIRLKGDWLESGSLTLSDHVVWSMLCSCFNSLIFPFRSSMCSSRVRTWTCRSFLRTVQRMCDHFIHTHYTQVSYVCAWWAAGKHQNQKVKSSLCTEQDGTKRNLQGQTLWNTLITNTREKYMYINYYKCTR